jgi:hypothetical protein
VGEISPLESRTAQATIYSNSWHNPEILDVRPSDSRFRCEIGTASAPAIKNTQAKWAKAISLTVPPGLDSGEINGAIHVTVRQTNTMAEGREVILPVRGRVLRRLAVYGDVNPRSLVDLGKITKGDTKLARLTMKVRDEQLELPVKRIEVTPEFLHVEVKRYETEQLGDGLYHLTIEVPATAPLCYHYSQEKFGKIHLEFDHPRIKELDLKVAFQVDPKW